MRRRDGFTLIELAIAVCIMMVILLLAVPSVRGVLADRQLRRSLNNVNRLVAQAQERSIAERRSYLIVWREKQFALRPESFLQGEERKAVATVNWEKNEAVTLTFPDAIDEAPPSEWVFWPSGNCEPAVVTYRGASGAWRAKYSALTARPKITDYATR